MNRNGFDNDLYMKKQKEHILERIRQANGKLYLEFGGKLFDDYHAARVLPGFDVNAKIKLLYELKEQAEKGNQEAVRELEERRAIARERSRKSAEKRKQRAENDPEYAKYLEEKNAEYNRRHTARRKEQLEALKAKAEAGDQEAQSQLAEHKQYQVRATVKSYRKMRDDALNGDPIAKERYEKTLAKRREAYHAKKSEQTA